MNDELLNNIFPTDQSVLWNSCGQHIVFHKDIA